MITNNRDSLIIASELLSRTQSNLGHVAQLLAIDPENALEHSVSNALAESARLAGTARAHVEFIRANSK